jgi:hypothetical protein
MKRIATIVTLATLALASCGGSDEEADAVPPATDAPTTIATTTSTTSTTSTTLPENDVITGVFTLTDSAVNGSYTTCYGTGGYDDFGPGVNVTVRDQDGSIVGSSSTRNLARGDDNLRPEMDEVVNLAIQYPDVSCTVLFEVEVNPAEFYEIEVGSRGGLSYSADELDSRDWWVELSLG